MTGKLIIVPTPIGNMMDMTPRAIEVLRQSDVILSEDTRRTGLLLKHFEINGKMESFHAHNEHKKLKQVLDRLKSGDQIALVSDAGTPGISDPGFLISRACRENEITVECLPGANAFVPALVQSGLPMERFTFEGFLPVKKGRQTRLNSLVEEPRTMIFYESPHRIVKTVKELGQYFGNDREASVWRELTKKFEQGYHGTLEQVAIALEAGTIKGEFVIVVAGKK